MSPRKGPPYTQLRGKCPLCSRTFDLELHPEKEQSHMIVLNRGDAAFLPNPAGYYMPAHRFAGSEFGAVPCPTSFRLVQEGH